jgi:hypothetical protein
MEHHMHADSVTSIGHDEKPMSGMAVTAFVLTLIFCIPVLPLIGLLLGLGAMGRTSADGPMRGRPLAITAVILGLLMTVGQVYATVQIVKVAQIFGDSITSVITGPEESMQAAFGGDNAKATSFWWEGDAPSEAETAAFVTAAKARFGGFEKAFPSDGTEPGAGAGQSEFTLPFTFTFSNGTFDGEVAFVATKSGDTTTGGSYLGIDKIIIKDPDGADLVWAAGTAAATEAVTGAADEAGTDAPKQEEAASPAAP